MGILVIIIIVVVIVIWAITKSNGDGNLEEIENAILSNDLGNTDWSSLRSYLESRGISEEQYRDIRYAAHKKRAENGFADSQYFYAVLNERSNKDESEKYYILAAEQGFVSAVTRLMYAYADDGAGGVFEKNPDKELYWTKRGAELGNLSAMVKLARDYFLGEIVEKDAIEQERWLRKAADLGSAEACIELSRLMKYAQNVQEQIQLLRRAVSLAGESNDKDAFESACMSLGYKYKPMENNPNSDAKKSTYFFFLSYVLGNDYSKNASEDIDYVATRRELESWVEDAKKLRIRF